MANCKIGHRKSPKSVNIRLDLGLKKKKNWGKGEKVHQLPLSPVNLCILRLKIYLLKVEHYIVKLWINLKSIAGV